MAPFAVASAAVAAFLGSAPGCSVLYDLNTDQCSADADCAALGGAFETLVCIDNLCQEPPITGCQSNAQCMDEQGGSGIDAWACVDRECVPLVTPECPTLLPQTDELWRSILRSDNPVILAGTGQVGGTMPFDNILRNYDLALTELERKTSGLPSGRKVMMIGCQGVFDDEEGLDREMEHLANVVKVPGIATVFPADELQRAFTEYGSAADMFFVSAFDSDPTLAVLQDRGLMWHMLSGSQTIARAYAPLLTRTLGYLGVSSNVKVATVVTTDYRLVSNMLGTIQGPPDEYGLSFNGATVAENRDAGNYRTINITSGDTSSITAQVASILELLPTVIISAADRQFIRMITAIEAGWPTTGTPPPRPFYILSPDNYNAAQLRTLIGSNNALASRMAGVNVAAAEDTRLYDDYIGRWDAAFPELTDVRGRENYYDAAYFLIYAAAAAGQNLTSGLNLLTGMNRLLAGAPFDVGPDDMPTAFATLAVGSASIQLNGTLGPPDFNPINGTRDSAGSIWCIDASQTFHADVLRYVPNDDDPTQATLTGTMPPACINGF